jgi:hypothetical protein
VANQVSGQTLINEAYKRADQEGATDRHPRTDVLRYVNQGRRELFDLLIEANGRGYFRAASPWEITTTENTTLYTSGYPAQFYRLVSVRVDDDNVGQPLFPFTPTEEADLRREGVSAYFPTHYEMRPNGLCVLPEHAAGKTITVEYIAAPADLTDAADSYVDGVNGWEEYIVYFAAMCIAEKDEDEGTIARCDAGLKRMHARIAKLAPKRDAFRPKRVTDVRGARMWGAGGRRF